MKTFLTRSSKEQWSVFGMIAALAFFGNFLFSADFGVYEDDYFFTVNAFNWSWSEMWSHVKHALSTWPQGRPIGFALTHFFTFLTSQSDSTTLSFLTAWAIVSFNGILTFSLVRPLTSVRVALIAASLVVLYPADGSRGILMLRVFQGLNLSCILIALLLYSRQRILAAYLIAPLSFLTYEHFFLPFVIAPFILLPHVKWAWRRLWVHAAYMVSVPAFCMTLRKLLGDPRASDVLSDPFQVLGKAASAILIGPYASGKSIILAGRDALLLSDATQFSIGFLVVCGCLAVVGRLSSHKFGRLDANSSMRMFILLIGGIAGWMAPYALAFRPDNYPPIATVGRLSGFNAPGSVGLALIVVALAYLIGKSAPLKVRTLGAFVGYLYVGLLVSYGIQIQRSDYVENWSQQKVIWTEVLSDAGDWAPQRPIIIDIGGPHAYAHSGTPGFPSFWVVSYSPLGLDQLAIVSWSSHDQNGTNQVSVYGYYDGMKTKQAEGAMFISSPQWVPEEAWPRLEDGEFLYYRFEEDGITRVTAPVKIGAVSLTPTPRGFHGTPTLRLQRAWQILFNRQEQWPSIANAKNYPG